jgi:ankyrin repeat protein
LESELTDKVSDYFEALQSGDLDRVSEFIKADPTLVNAKSPSGASAVITATYHGRRNIAELLVSKGATLNVFEASALGVKERVRELVYASPDLVNAYSPDGFTPLHLAVFFPNYETAELLISEGGKVNAVARNPMKVMPLHSAAAGNDSAIVELLLRNGAEVNATQQGGFTALHAAAQNGSLEMAKLLVQSGADVNARTEKGKTPLDMTREEGPEAGKKEDREAVAEFLRLQGAS